MKLTKKKLNEFKKHFETRKEEIAAAIQHSNDTAEVDHDGDELDAASAISINSVREQLSLRDMNQLNKINIALHKIEDGTFGICADCDEPISEKRLFAVLGCSQCIDCAQDQERTAKQYA